MRYSLLSRFQGAMLAAALGDDLGREGRLHHFQRQQQPANGQQDGQRDGKLEPRSRLAPVDFYQWRPGLTPAASPTVPAQDSFHSGAIAIAVTQTLIQSGRWQKDQIKQVWARLTASDRGYESATAVELAIATLPLMLFFHDDVNRQQRVLQQTLSGWQCPVSAEPALLAVGYAIAQALTERLDPQTLIPQTIAYLKQGTVDPSSPLLDLVGRLEQVQTLVQQKTGLHAAIEQLRTGLVTPGYGGIALAFYCFLTTPDQLHLAMVRVARSGYAAPATCALTGAISGAYSTLNGLPLSWQLAMHPDPDSMVPLRWGLSGAAIAQLTDHLFTVWAGGYDTAALTATMP